ncbi:MAG TPA: hypothetical protein VMV82_05060 [Candidatus Dormibacteraeota bacterium]|nr:hypothetical protein [Candidatus Dormibacteraeota bacterium]
MSLPRFALAAAALLSVSAIACVSADTPATLDVTMNAQSGSGEDGTATITQTSNGVQIVISLQNATSTPEPAHVHFGVCSDLGGVQHPLANVVNGSSTTTLPGVTISDLLSRPLAINVHKSADDLGAYVSCGDIHG